MCISTYWYMESSVVSFSHYKTYIRYFGVRISRRFDRYFQESIGYFCVLTAWNVEEFAWTLAMPFPVGSQRVYDVMITSLWRQNDVVASFCPHNDVVIASGVRWY